MSPFLMNSLKLSRQIPNKFLLFLLLLGSCAPQKSKDTSSVLPQPYLAQEGNGVVYDASFRYKGFQASGLLVMKRIEKAAYHIVLLSKFGPSIMEFKLNKEGISWIKTFEQLNKKSVENLIERDFRLLLQSGLEDPEQVKQVKTRNKELVFRLKSSVHAQLMLDPENHRVTYIENRKTFNPVKTKVFFEYGLEAIPNAISLQHNNVKMRLDLTLLKINHVEK